MPSRAGRAAAPVRRLPAVRRFVGRSRNVLIRRTRICRLWQRLTADTRSAVQLLPDTIVSLRRCRWRIVAVRTYDGCQLVTLRGAAPPVVGVERRVLSPFDRLEPVVPHESPRRVSAHRWRRACRAAIASDTPPGALRAPAGAHIDLIPSQLAPALAVVRGLGCRVLIADEVGLGKTIQAGLVISELRARDAIARVLVLTPAGLRDQWQSELRERFGLGARRADARSIRDAASSLPRDIDPWSTFDVVVASLDYVKRPEILTAAGRRPWDLVVVDEAHAAASDSDRRAAADALCTRASYVVLLTATPHSGDREAFASLCRLGRTGDDPLLVFRRSRRDVGVAVRRRAHTLHVRPSVHERRLHRALREYSDAILAERPQACLALSVLHKRALSSAAALAESVERRLATLNNPATADTGTQLVLPLDAGEATSDDEAPAWGDDLTLRSVNRERSLLVALAHAARAAARRESKFAVLGRFLARVGESVLVFTEYRDTLRHLERAIRRPAIVLHGGLTREERRAAVDRFTHSASAVMLATDAAGEGLNLQAACRTVINLELPWNPMRLEQRIGRVDRIGQVRTVHAIHLVARGTRETALLARLHERLADARSAVGAGNLFGTSEEQAAAELVVLGRLPRAHADGQPDVTGLVFPDLADAAQAEASRLAMVRRVVHTTATDDPPCALVMRARSALKRQLGGRRLEIWRLAVDDGRGRRAESRLVGVLIDGRSTDIGEAVVDAAQAWHTTVRDCVTAFSAARIKRETAVVEKNHRSAPVLDQTLLFADRRRVRERFLTITERNARQADLERRLDDAQAAAALVFRPPERLLIVVPSR